MYLYTQCYMYLYTVKSVVRNDMNYIPLQFFKINHNYFFYENAPFKKKRDHRWSLLLTH